MTSLLNCIVQVILNDTRIMTGQLLAFDRHMNLVIADTQESRVTKAGAARQRAAAANGEVKRTLGMIILRGEHIVSLTVISPPP
ncbi:Sm-like ribonucleoprotein, partial [Ramicandelaber brevisporus]